MRRVTIFLLAAAILCAGLASDSVAGKPKRKTRTVEATYLTSALGLGGVEHFCVAEPLGCVFIPIEKGEKFVDIEIVDQAGQPIYASVYTHGYTEPDGLDPHEHVCGKSDDPLAIDPGLETLAVVVVHATSVTAGCEGIVTAGTVKTTFSNIP